MVSRYVRQGTNREKPWEQANTWQFWKGSRTRRGRPSAWSLALLFEDNRLVLDVDCERTGPNHRQNVYAIWHGQVG